MRIAIDLDGGDRGAKTVVSGIKAAIKNGWVSPEQITALGTPESLAVLLRRTHEVSGIECTEEIAMGEALTPAILHRNCAIVTGIKGVRDGRFDAFVSAGETKAVVGLGKTLLSNGNKKLKPAIAVPLPTISGKCLLVDAGAIIDPRAEDLLHNAQMGCIYVSRVWGIEDPRVGILNIGEEKTKGNDVIRQAHQLLRQSGLNFVGNGNIEANDIFRGVVDVVACSGHDGNIVLKAGEGIVEMLFTKFRAKLKKHPLAYLALPILWPFLRDLKKDLSYDEIGGANLLGVRGCLIICHRRANQKPIANAIRTAVEEIDANVNTAIA